MIYHEMLKSQQKIDKHSSSCQLIGNHFSAESDQTIHSQTECLTFLHVFNRQLVLYLCRHLEL